MPTGFALCHIWGMGKIGKGKKQLGVVISARLAKLIEARATTLGLSPSRFTAMIIEQWAAQGHPPVSQPDRLMIIAEKQTPRASVK